LKFIIPVSKIIRTVVQLPVVVVGCLSHAQLFTP